MRQVGWMAAVLFAGMTAAGAFAAGLTTIDGAQLEAMMADGAPLVIVDVREPELFVKGHLRGAINIPFEKNDHSRIVNELSPADRIVFVCHGGPMGDEWGKVLAGEGYPTVFNLRGGMKKWKGGVVR